MQLFKRFVQLKIVTNKKEYIINDDPSKDQLKISFNISKSKYKTPNTANIEVYGLNKEFRDILSNEDMYLTFHAGYVDNHPIIFKGNCVNVWHKLEGVDWVTSFVAGEGFVNIRDSKSVISFKKNEKLSEVLTSLSSDMKLEFDGLEQEIQLKAKEVLHGSSAELIDKMCKSYDLEYHISDEKVKIFKKSIERDKAIKISSDSGLLKDNGVVKTELGVNISSMLLPTIQAGDSVYLDASYINDIKQNSLAIAKQDTTLESMNGFYKVLTIKHTGDNYSGGFKSEMECMSGTV
jgi:hypothetical protein